MSPIRLLLVDDQNMFREGVATLLSLHETLEVAGEAGDGREALALAQELKPDVVLMDLRMPEMDGVETTRRLRQVQPEARVIILTTFDDDENLFEALRAGAVGYLLKDSSSEKLVEAISAAARGESFLQPSIASKVLAEFSRLKPRAQDLAEVSQRLIEKLSQRELEILREVAQGRSNKEIARKLFLAEGTVKNHMTNILGKLAVQDRTQAALEARRLGLV